MRVGRWVGSRESCTMIHSSATVTAESVPQVSHYAGETVPVRAQSLAEPPGIQKENHCIVWPREVPGGSRASPVKVRSLTEDPRRAKGEATRGLVSRGGW